MQRYESLAHRINGLTPPLKTGFSCGSFIQTPECHTVVVESKLKLLLAKSPSYVGSTRNLSLNPWHKRKKYNHFYLRFIFLSFQTPQFCTHHHNDLQVFEVCTFCGQNFLGNEVGFIWRMTLLQKIQEQMTLTIRVYVEWKQQVMIPSFEKY